MFEDIKKKFGQVLGHPITRKISDLGEDVLQVTYQLASNKNVVSLGSAVMAGVNIIADAFDVPIESATTYFVNKHNLELKNGSLHKLLIRAGAQTKYPLTVAMSTDNLSMMKLDFGDGDCMYWASSMKNVDAYDGFAEDTSNHNQFWVNPDFNFKKVNDFFWDKYVTGISLSYGKTDKGGVEISSLPILSAYEDAGEHSASSMIEYIKKSKQMGISRSFLLYGEPGTGKTSWVEKVAEGFGSRFVKLDSAFVQSLRSTDVEQILDTLGPEIILFDDFDRLNIDVYEGTFLYIIENIKRKYPSVTFFATVNDPEELSAALLRPGRFDEKIEFKLNNNKSSLKILIKYAEIYNLKYNEKELAAAVGKNNFTPAECKEAISRKLLNEKLSFAEIFEDLFRYRGFGSSADNYHEDDEEVYSPLPKKKRKGRKSDKSFGEDM